MPNLIVTTSEDRRLSVSPEDEPNLHRLWSEWRTAPRGSSREAHLWREVLSAANDAIDGSDLLPISFETAEDVEELRPTEGYCVTAEELQAERDRLSPEDQAILATLPQGPTD